MEISHEVTETKPAITVMKLSGEIDSATTPAVVEACQAVFADGARNLLLDLSDVSFMGSSGLVALHNLARIMRGESALNDNSVHALHDVKYELMNAESKEAHFRLLSPQPRIEKTLKMTGFDRLLHIYADREEAIASFA